jgi:OOP family OmpA-OmpF porin
MKKQILIALIGTALAAPFAVQAEGFYVGGNIGRAEQKLSNVNVGTDKDTSTGFKLVGGYNFTKYVGAEVGYVVFGKGETNLFAPDTANSKPRAFYTAATGTLPLDAQFALTGKVGVSANRVKSSGTDTGAPFTEKGDRITALVGIGATYNFAPNLAAVVEYERFGKVEKSEEGYIKADLLSVGVRYKF